MFTDIRRLRVAAVVTFALVQVIGGGAEGWVANERAANRESVSGK